MTNEESIMHLENIKIYSFQDGYTDEARESLEMAIKALSEQRTGHWIELPTHESQSGLPWYECSECNSERCIAVLRDFKYCPNCGAKMQEVKDD